LATKSSLENAENPSPGSGFLLSQWESNRLPFLTNGLYVTADTVAMPVVKRGIQVHLVGVITFWMQDGRPCEAVIGVKVSVYVGRGAPDSVVVAAGAVNSNARHTRVFMYMAKIHASGSSVGMDVKMEPFIKFA
jgi:hypothetical protein